MNIKFTRKSFLYRKKESKTEIFSDALEFNQFSSFLFKIKYFVGIVVFLAMIAGALFTFKFVERDYYLLNFPLDIDKTRSMYFDDKNKLLANLNAKLNSVDFLTLLLQENNQLGDVDIAFYQKYLEDTRKPENKFILKFYLQNDDFYLQIIGKNKISTLDEARSFIEKTNHAANRYFEESNDFLMLSLENRIHSLRELYKEKEPEYQKKLKVSIIKLINFESRLARMENIVSSLSYNNTKKISQEKNLVSLEKNSNLLENSHLSVDNFAELNKILLNINRYFSTLSYSIRYIETMLSIALIEKKYSEKILKAFQQEFSLLKEEYAQIIIDFSSFLNLQNLQLEIENYNMIKIQEMLEKIINISFVINQRAMTNFYLEKELCQLVSFKIKLLQNIFSAVLVSLFLCILFSAIYLSLINAWKGFFKRKN
ncbi:MAG: hypothetical protein K2X39_10275 [Silvanigrellaceae bacterium]|nr:hypothetical protein [Silvanigrellaceae bacterium]